MRRILWHLIPVTFSASGLFANDLKISRLLKICFLATFDTCDFSYHNHAIQIATFATLSTCDIFYYQIRLDLHLIAKHAFQHTWFWSLSKIWSTMTPYPEFIVRRNRIQHLAIQGPFTLTSKNYGADTFLPLGFMGHNQEIIFSMWLQGQALFFSLEITGRIPF